MNIKLEIDKDWTFNDSVSANFDEHIKKSIPGYERMQDKAVELCEWFIRENSNVYDIGCSTGALLNKLKEKYKNRKANFIGIDKQISMKGNHFDNENMKFLECDINDFQSFENSSVIISFFTIQFLHMGDREKLHKNIYNSLNKGDLFIWAEKVKNEKSTFSEMNKSLLLEFKLNKGINSEEILKKDRSLRGVMRLKTNAENLNDLKKCGYSEVDLIYKENDFVLYACIK